MFCHKIEEQCLVNLLNWQNITGETETIHKRNYKELEARVKRHKDKPKKETNNDNFSHMQNTETPEGHIYMISYFNVTKKRGKNHKK